MFYYKVDKNDYILAIQQNPTKEILTDKIHNREIYIQGFYNINRIYSDIGYLTHCQFEKTFAS